MLDIQALKGALAACAHFGISADVIKTGAISLPQLFEHSLAQHGVRDVMRLLGEGRVQEATRAAKTPGFLPPHPVGHPVRLLGTRPSREGAVAMTLSPQRGISASKFYTPGSLTTPRLLSAKEEAAKIQHPAVVPLQEVQHMEGLHAPIHHYDYVPGSTLKSLERTGWTGLHPLAQPGIHRLGPAYTYDEAVASIQNLRNLARTEHGVTLRDPHHENIMIDHAGQGRLVDSIPMRAGDPDPTRREDLRFFDPHEGLADTWNTLEGEDFEPAKKGPPPKVRPPRRGDPGFPRF